MEDLTTVALWGPDANAYGTLGAQMVNPVSASGDTDWGAILTNGIRGAAQGAIAAQVNGAYASGQLVNSATGQRAGQGSLLTLLLIGGVIWAVMQ